MGTSKLTIIIDTREKNPYNFDRYDCCQQVKKLNTGDYSIKGLDKLICIERKSKIDAYQTIGKNRKRFIKELERMKTMWFKALIIECNLDDFLIPPAKSSLNPKSAINSLLAWQVRYNLHLHFSSNKKISTSLVFNLLQKFYTECNK